MTDAPISWPEQKAREKEAAMEMRRQWIAEGLEHYGTAAAFAKATGMDPRHLHRHMDAAGLDRPKKPRNRDAEYKRCAAKGMTQAEAARHLGVDRSSISIAATRLGLKFKPAQRGASSLKDRDAEYRRCAAEGMTQAETARHLGINHSSISAAAKRLGLDFERGKTGRKKPCTPAEKKPLTPAEMMAKLAQQENEAMRKRL